MLLKVLGYTKHSRSYTIPSRPVEPAVDSLDEKFTYLVEKPMLYGSAPRL